MRRPGSPDEPADDRGKPPAGRPTLPLSYGVTTWVVAAKFTVAAALVVAALFADGRTQAVIAALAAVGLAIYGFRDVVARERLRVDTDGLTVVRGFAGRVQLGWDQIERVRVDERLRLGVRNQLLEVDAGDWIGLYGRHELGADPQDVAAAITAAHSQQP